MKRFENETFELYRARRAAANRVSKALRQGVRGGSVSSRVERRAGDAALGGYGANLKATFDKKNRTPARIEAHELHMFKAAATKEVRRRTAEALA